MDILTIDINIDTSKMFNVENNFYVSIKINRNECRLLTLCTGLENLNANPISETFYEEVVYERHVKEFAWIDISGDVDDENKPIWHVSLHYNSRSSQPIPFNNCSL